MKNLLALLIITFSLLGCATLSTTPTTPTPPKEMTEIYGKWNSTTLFRYNRFVKISPTKLELYDTIISQRSINRLDATFHVEYLTTVKDNRREIYHVFKVVNVEAQDTYEQNLTESTYIAFSKNQGKNGNDEIIIKHFFSKDFNNIEDFISISHYAKSDD